MIPKMIVVAGPPGSGKSTAFPVSGFGVAFFNAVAWQLIPIFGSDFP
jgi:hypothetical protein